MNPVGIRPEKDCSGEPQHLMLTTGPPSRQRGRLTLKNSQLSKDNKKKIKIGHEPQMGCLAARTTDHHRS
jgi:hypothetical protein